MRSLLSLVATTAMFHLGCFPFYGHDRRPVEHGAISFRDAQTAERISEVLIIPSVSKGIGLGFMRSHSDFLFLLGSARTCLAHPFVHQAGTQLAVQQPKTAALFFLLPPGVFGRIGGLDGALVAAFGYRSHFFDTWELLEAHELHLTAAAPEASVVEMTELLRLLEQGTVVGNETRWFRPHYQAAPPEPNEIDVCFSEEERQLVEDFLSQTP